MADVIHVKFGEEREWDAVERDLRHALAGFGAHVPEELRELIIAETIAALQRVTKAPTEQFSVPLLLPDEHELREQVMASAKTAIEAAMTRQMQRDQQIWLAAIVDAIANVLSKTSR